MFVPAHTSKIGYFVQSRTYLAQNKLKGTDSFGNPYSWNDSYKPVPMAYSNKAPTIKSDSIAPTVYWRKIARMEGNGYDIESNSNLGRGDSLHWMTLNFNPYGNAYSTSTVSVPSWMTDQVIQQATADLMDLRANVLEDLGQARQTMSMLVNIFTTIVKLFVMAWKGQWRKLRRTLRGMGHRPSKKAANGWLMYYYGIRPLVSTIDAICSANGPKVKSVTKKRKVSDPLDPSVFISTTGPIWSGEASRRAMCGITATLNMDSSFRYWQSLGLTNDNWTDAVVTAWALVPYSFVLDWILPVERFLRTRRFASGISALHAYVSTSQIAKVEVIATWIPGSLYVNVRGQLPKANARSLQFQRQPYHGIVPPSGLSLNISLSPTNLINAAALIIQRR